MATSLEKLEDEKWTKITPMATVSVEGNIYSGKEILRDLPPNDYQVRVRAKNSHGWSLYSEEQIFNGEFSAESTNGGTLKSKVTALLSVIIASHVLFM